MVYVLYCIVMLEILGASRPVADLETDQRGPK